MCCLGTPRDLSCSTSLVYLHRIFIFNFENVNIALKQTTYTNHDLTTRNVRKFSCIEPLLPSCVAVVDGGIAGGGRRGEVAAFSCLLPIPTPPPPRPTSFLELCPDTWPEIISRFIFYVLLEDVLFRHRIG